MKNTKHNKGIKRKGFSLVELLVATALFTIVVAVSAGSFLSILEASRQSRELNELMLVVDYAMEDMSRTIRTGTDLRLYDGSTFYDGGSRPAIELIDENGYRVRYGRSGTTLIKRSGAFSDGGHAMQDFTPEDIKINHLSFSKEQSSADDQPRIIINIAGQLGSNTDDRFYVQTSVTQRELNVAPVTP
ncbi:MAG: prepilin-type N-terminal cleavage/methylation domain-containing protein [Candidatus Paceibacterota bacterium]